jgi:hypothetical protein
VKIHGRASDEGQESRGVKASTNDPYTEHAMSSALSNSCPISRLEKTVSHRPGARGTALEEPEAAGDDVSKGGVGRNFCQVLCTLLYCLLTICSVSCGAPWPCLSSCATSKIVSPPCILRVSFVAVLPRP